MSTVPQNGGGRPGRVSTLAAESVGFPEVLFQSLTYISPGTSLALVLPFVVVFSGGALPLVVIFIFIGCFSTAWLLGEMSGKLPSSGGMLTFIANGLGPNAGFMAGWLYALCLLADVAGIFLLLAEFVANQLNASLGWNPTAVWVIVTIALAAFVTLNGLRRASRGTQLGAILGTIEVLVFAILSVWLIIRAGSRNTLQVFTTHFANAPGYHGVSGIVAAAVLTILAYQGFESAAVLGEEARRPRVSVKAGMLVSVAAILVYFILATYASTVYYGAARMVGFASYGKGAPWDQLARSVWGVGWIIVFLAIVNSVTACANAANITTTRTLFAMSRAGVLPDRLSSVNRHDVPGPAQILTTVVALGAALAAAIVWGPAVAATFLLTITSGIIIVLYIVSAITCVSLYYRRFRSEFSIVRHVFPALLVVVCFVPAFLATFGIRAFRFVTPLAWPETLIAPIVIAWIVIGVAIGIYLVRSRTRGLDGVQDLYAEATPAPLADNVPGTV
jgi:amino acid transporter